MRRDLRGMSVRSVYPYRDQHTFVYSVSQALVMLGRDCDPAGKHAPPTTTANVEHAREVDTIVV